MLRWHWSKIAVFRGLAVSRTLLSRKRQQSHNRKPSTFRHRRAWKLSELSHSRCCKEASILSTLSSVVLGYPRGLIEWCVAHRRPVLPLVAAANCGSTRWEKGANVTWKFLVKISSCLRLWIICLVAKQRALQVQNPATVSCSQTSQERCNIQTTQKKYDNQLLTLFCS